MDNQEKSRQPIPTGNDMSDGDAREEGRMDKDEDLKDGDDKDSPLAKPFNKKRPLTPHSLSEPDANNGHTKKHMAEEEQHDPTDEDAPESEINKGA